MIPATIEPAVLTIDDLAALFRCHRCSIYKLIRRQGLPGWKLGTQGQGGDYRFNTEQVLKWMDEQQSKYERTHS